MTIAPTPDAEALALIKAALSPTEQRWFNGNVGTIALKTAIRAINAALKSRLPAPDPAMEMKAIEAKMNARRAMCEDWAAAVEDEDHAKQWQERADAITHAIEAIEPGHNAAQAYLDDPRHLDGRFTPRMIMDDHFTTALAPQAGLRAMLVRCRDRFREFDAIFTVNSMDGEGSIDRKRAWNARAMADEIDRALAGEAAPDA